MKKRILKITLILAAALLTFWLGSIGKCEILTVMHAAEFENLWQEHTMLREPDRLIVLEYTNTTARVYHRRKDGGNILHYSREAGDFPWEFTLWETVWAYMGSADDIMWPYIR